MIVQVDEPGEYQCFLAGIDLTRIADRRPDRRALSLPDGYDFPRPNQDVAILNDRSCLVHRHHGTAEDNAQCWIEWLFARGGLRQARRRARQAKKYLQVSDWHRQPSPGTVGGRAHGRPLVNGIRALIQKLGRWTLRPCR